MKIVFIHGRDQQGKNPDVLHSVWRETLNSGFASTGLEVRQLVTLFPFYGDALGNMMAHFASAPPTRSAESNANFFQKIDAEILESLCSRSIVESRQFGDATAYRGGIENNSFVLSVLRRLDFSSIAKSVIQQVFADVYTYLTDSRVGSSVDKIVLGAIPQNEEIVLVGHSLGSVVACRVLERLGEIGSRCRRLITLGSPLGISAVHELAGSPNVQLMTYPWFNARDERDIVALKVAKSVDARGYSRVVNFCDVRNGTENRHGIEGYLADPVVASVICESARLS